MRKVIVLLLALLLCPSAAGAELLKRGEELGATAQADYPGWRLITDSVYSSGLWEDERADHCRVYLLRVAEGQLLLKELYVLMNPLQPGEPVPWEETDYAPVPLTEEAQARLEAMDAGAIFSHVEGKQLHADALPGCAEFLLNAGETLERLLVHEEFLVAEVYDAGGREGLRIAHWDGAAYRKVTATAMSETDVFVNASHSVSGALEIYLPEAEVWAYCDEDVWRLSVVLSYVGESYSVVDGVHGYESYSTDVVSNAAHFYGSPTFQTTLDGLDLGDVPADMAAAVARLDAAGYACVKRDGAPLYDAPEGSVIASCYARLTGTVRAEQDGWVQLQIGSSEHGMTGWFRREDMAFGAEVNAVECTFPAYDDGLWWRDQVDDADLILPGVTDALGCAAAPWELQIWLIARRTDGDWLVLVNSGIVMTGAQERFAEVVESAVD